MKDAEEVWMNNFAAVKNYVNRNGANGDIWGLWFQNQQKTI